MQKHWYPLGSFSFHVYIGGKKIGFSRVSGIELMDEKRVPEILHLFDGKQPKTKSTGMYQQDSGSDMDMGRHHKHSQHQLQLEKAVVPNLQSAEQSFLLKLLDSNVLIHEIKIEILNASRKPAAVLLFKTCRIVSCQLSDLDATSNGYVTQTFRIIYESVELKAPGN